MGRRRGAVFTTALLVLQSNALAAQAHPDFTGVWVLDASRSDSSSFTPKSATYAIVQRGDSIVVDRETPGTGKSHTVYGLDSKPRTNTLRLVGTETEATSMVAWTGAVMVVRTNSHPGDADLVQVDTWTLAPDGKTLRIRREATYGGRPMGSPTLVFVKQ